MKYDRAFLESVHNDIKADMAAIELKPHDRPQNLISHFTYGCDFYTLRYWRSADTELLRMTGRWYNQSNVELVVIGDKLYIGIWFGKNNRNPLEYSRLLKYKQDIIDKATDYPGYQWEDENENQADNDLIKWLFDSNHETVFRKELTSYNKDIVVSEILHLKEYLDLLLNV